MEMTVYSIYKSVVIVTLTLCVAASLWDAANHFPLCGKPSIFSNVTYGGYKYVAS